MLKNKTVLLLLVLTLTHTGMFVLGDRFGQYKSAKDVAIAYANMLGDQIVQTNEVYELPVSERGTKNRNSFNKMMLVDIGCSIWLKSLEGMNLDKLPSFTKGVQQAYTISGSSFERDNKCIKALHSLGVLGNNEKAP